MWRVWVAAARPKTLPAALAPVLAGTALAAEHGSWRLDLACGCLGCALALQIACNYANDAGDARRGADGPDRLGPPRAVASGAVSARAMLIASAIAALIALPIGLWLAAASGWPLLLVGAAAMLAAFAYTLGPWPLAYHGLGDAFVLLFFGPVAVLGSAWVQHPGWPLPVPWWWTGLAIGLQATVLIAINNLRDIDSDARVGKRTIAVRLGKRASRLYHAALHTAATIAWMLADRPLAATVTGCAGGALAVAVWRSEGRSLNRCLALAALALLASTVASVLERHLAAV